MSEKTFESRGANRTSSFRYPCTKATACRDAHDLHGKVFFLHIPKCSGTSFTYEARQLLPNIARGYDERFTRRCFLFSFTRMASQTFL